MTTSNHIPLPLIIEDFEPGDRVYCIPGSLVDPALFGNVSSIQESSLTILMDSGEKVTVPFIRFHRETGERWRKCIPIQQVGVGSILSSSGEDPDTGEWFTTFARVEKMIGDEVVLTYLDTNKTYSLYATERTPLESVLRNWEIEG